MVSIFDPLEITGRMRFPPLTLSGLSPLPQSYAKASDAGIYVHAPFP